MQGPILDFCRRQVPKAEHVSHLSEETEPPSPQASPILTLHLRWGGSSVPSDGLTEQCHLHIDMFTPSPFKSWYEPETQIHEGAAIECTTDPRHRISFCHGRTVLALSAPNFAGCPFTCMPYTTGILQIQSTLPPSDLSYATSHPTPLSTVDSLSPCRLQSPFAIPKYYKHMHGSCVSDTPNSHQCWNE